MLQLVISSSTESHDPKARTLNLNIRRQLKPAYGNAAAFHAESADLLR